MRSALLLVVLTAACAWVDPDPAWADRPAGFAEASWQAPAAIPLQGFDPPAPAERVANGDRIVYRVQLEKGDTRRSWLVHAEVEDAEYMSCTLRDGSRSCMLRIRVRVDDESGAEVGRDLVGMSREDVVFGLFRACRGDQWSAAEIGSSFAVVPLVQRAHLGLLNMMQVIQGSKVLFSVLRQVIDPPSLLSILTNLGVWVRTDVRFDKAVALEPVEIDGHRYPVYELPVELQLNRQPALRCKVLVAEPDSPLNLSAGILGIDAFQPSDPTARVTIRVVAARRSS